MVVNCVHGSFHVKSPDGPMGNTSDFIENTILKISAVLFIWLKNYYSLNFAKNQSKMPFVRGKQDFPNFGVK